MGGTRLNGSVVIVTGASSGIGREVSRVLVARGARVVLAARGAAALAELASELDPNGSGAALAVPADVTDPASVAALVKATMARHGRIDVVVANAGITQRAEFLDTDVAVVRRLVEVNYFGVVNLLHAALPAMVARGSGRLVIVSSIAGRVATGLRSGYSSSKFALHGLANALRLELAPKGIGVTVICPGFTRTAISRHALLGDGREQGHDDPAIAKGMDPREVAEATARAIERGDREVHLSLMGRFAVALGAIAPRTLDWLLLRVPVR